MTSSDAGPEGEVTVQGNWLLLWHSLIRWLLAVLVCVSFCWGNGVVAADDAGADTYRMDGQRQAYQSQYNLIKAVQKRLDAYGYQPGPLDGILGPKTKAALMAFQKDHGLLVDGLVGIETLEQLNLIRE